MTLPPLFVGMTRDAPRIVDLQCWRCGTRHVVRLRLPREDWARSTWACRCGGGVYLVAVSHHGGVYVVE